jgi:hypothetical protein
MTIHPTGKSTFMEPKDVVQSVTNSSASNYLVGSAAKLPPGVPLLSREAMIATAAYYLAEHRGFETGRELDDWLAAENEISLRLKGLSPPRLEAR